MKERFVVYISEDVLRRFNDEVEARAFAREISKRDEIVVTVVDTFLGTESVYREFPIWF